VPFFQGLGENTYSCIEKHCTEPLSLVWASKVFLTATIFEWKAADLK